jgi:type IV pilus biogenesis protein CpaD/CtpE
MKFTALVSISLIAVVLFMAGCASTGYNKAGATTTSIEQTAAKIQQGNEQIDTVLIALSSLMNSPEADIRRQFEEFNTAVSKLETLSNEVNTNATAMQVQGADYFRTWNVELAKIQNENIRKRSTERKNTVAARFDAVRANYARTKADFAPFMSDLKDIRTALAMDLTAGGLVSIKSASSKAKENALPLRRSLSNLAADFTSLGISLSSSTPVK